MESKQSRDLSPTYVVVSEPLSTSSSIDHIPSVRVRSEELQRSVSSPQVCNDHSRISFVRIEFLCFVFSI